jgi:hypothetical protein
MSRRSFPAVILTRKVILLPAALYSVMVCAGDTSSLSRTPTSILAMDREGTYFDKRRHGKVDEIQHAHAQARSRS